MTLTSVILFAIGAFVSQLDQFNDLGLTIDMHVLNVRPVAGEPLVVDLTVRNETKKELCTPPQFYIDGGLVRFSLYVYREKEFVGRSRAGGDCSRQFGVVRVDGQCQADSKLSPGQELHGRGLAVLLAAQGSDPYGPTASIPLGPGRYTLRGELLWGTWRLPTDDVQITIEHPSTPDDIKASQLVDPVYAVLMSSNATLGMGTDMMPVGSVKSILEKYPTSVHARLARSRLLVLQTQRLSRYATVPDKTVENADQQRKDLLKRIDEHLHASPDDPLELDLLDGKVQLQRRLEDEDGLRKAIDALIRRFPDSGRARRADELSRQLQSDPGDEK